jgi:hypothetical protein
MTYYEVSASAQRIKENGEGVALVQEGKLMKAKDIKLWHCSKKGHCRSNCPKLKVEGSDDGIQNFTIKEFDDGNGLFLAN